METSSFPANQLSAFVQNSKPAMDSVENFAELRDLVAL